MSKIKVITIESYGKSRFIESAIDVARLMAKEGPRTVCIIKHPDGQFTPLPGFVDGDHVLPTGYQQVALCTPDGQVWLRSFVVIPPPDFKQPVSFPVNPEL